jgi:hypothetical protein
MSAPQVVVHVPQSPAPATSNTTVAATTQVQTIYARETGSPTIVAGPLSGYNHVTTQVANAQSTFDNVSDHSIICGLWCHYFIDRWIDVIVGNE